MARGRRNRRGVTYREYTESTIAEKPMVGPEPGRNTRCLVCHKLICAGEHWRKVYPADTSYAVAVHDGCRIGSR